MAWQLSPSLRVALSGIDGDKRSRSRCVSTHVDEGLGADSGRQCQSMYNRIGELRLGAGSSTNEFVACASP